MTGGMHTPWGVAHTKQQLDEGVFWVQTAVHGGILIDISKATAILTDKAISEITFRGEKITSLTSDNVPGAGALGVLAQLGVPIPAQS